MERYLALWLEAPLQCWGSDSKFGRRDTLPFPTKSGIFGLYLAALGAQGEQKELLSKLAVFPLNIYSFRRSADYKNSPLSGKTPFLMDFQMVGSGYRDSKEYPWERLLIPKTAEGKPAVGGGSKMTYRYYLQDARFGVVHKLSPQLADDLEKALQNPVFYLYLGRKNCVPSDFLFRGNYESFEKAEATVFDIAGQKNLVEDFRILDGEFEGEEMVINDVPIQFGEFKMYRERIITVLKNAR